MSDMDPGLSLYISMWSITAVTRAMASHSWSQSDGAWIWWKEAHKIKIPYVQYVFPTPIVTIHHSSAPLNIPGCD